MEVKNIQNTPNFTAKYHIKGGAKEFQKIKNAFLPLYTKTKMDPAIAVNPDELFRRSLRDTVSEIAKGEGYAISWLVSNAANHGIALNVNDSNDIFVFTGKDVLGLKNVLKKSDSFSQKIKNSFTTLNEITKCVFQGLPEHLITTKACMARVEAYEKPFYAFAQENCKKLQSVDELRKELLR